MVWCCILLVHAFALASPATTSDVAASTQDAMIVHALVAFMPEVVGTALRCTMALLRGLLDRRVAQD